jgi:hypothetical protein
VRKQYAGVGVDWLPQLVRGAGGWMETAVVKRKEGDVREVFVRGVQSGRLVWSTLGESDVIKERHYLPWKRYAEVYAEGTNEPRRRKRSVGRKVAMASAGRPIKWTKRHTLEGLALQQDHRSAWDRVDRQRIRRYWRSKYGEGQRGGEFEEYRAWKRRRRQCERARNLYEYSTMRRVVRGVSQEMTLGRRNKKEGRIEKGLAPLVPAEPLWKRPALEETPTRGRKSVVSAVLQEEDLGKSGIAGIVEGEEAEFLAAVPLYLKPFHRGTVVRWKGRQLSLRVQGESRHYGYGVDAKTTRTTYREEVCWVFSRSAPGTPGTRDFRKPQRFPLGSAQLREAGSVQNRRLRGRWTLLGGRRERNMRLQEHGRYSIWGEGYGARQSGGVLEELEGRVTVSRAGTICVDMASPWVGVRKEKKETVRPAPKDLLARSDRWCLDAAGIMGTGGTLGYFLDLLGEASLVEEGWSDSRKLRRKEQRELFMQWKPFRDGYREFFSGAQREREVRDRREEESAIPIPGIGMGEEQRREKEQRRLDEYHIVREQRRKVEQGRAQWVVRWEGIFAAVGLEQRCPQAQRAARRKMQCSVMWFPTMLDRRTDADGSLVS